MTVNKQPRSVREANVWLNRVGVTQYRFSSKLDDNPVKSGKIYYLSKLQGGKFEAIKLSEDFAECLSYAIHCCDVPQDWVWD